MTERKPPFTSFETWIDRQIREAQDRGEFDDLPGAGKPLPDDPAEPMWWVKRKLREEDLSTEAVLPTPLRLRKEIERLPETVRDLPSERAVRDLVQALNARIVEWVRAPAGPRVHIAPVNVESVVEQWRAGREVAVVPRADAVSAHREDVRVPWWRRIAARRRRT